MTRTRMTVQFVQTYGKAKACTGNDGFLQRKYIYDPRSYVEYPHKHWSQSTSEEVGRAVETSYRELFSGSANCVREYVRRNSKSTLGMGCQR